MVCEKRAIILAEFNSELPSIKTSVISMLRGHVSLGEGKCCPECMSYTFSLIQETDMLRWAFLDLWALTLLQSGRVGPDVTSLRSRITDLEEEREETLWKLEQYDEIKAKNGEEILQLSSITWLHLSGPWCNELNVLASFVSVILLWTSPWCYHL